MPTEIPISSLIEDLWHPDSSIRRQAIEALIARGEKAVPPLLEALRRDDCNESVVEFENPALRQALLGIGEPAFKALIGYLLSDDTLGRAAVKMLVMFQDRRAVEPLIQVMLDNTRNKNVRVYTIDALGYYRDRRAFDPLLSVLKEDDVLIRGHAARALGKYRDRKAIGPIRAALNHPGKTPLMDWRFSAEVAIKRLEDPEFVGTDCSFFDQYMFTSDHALKRDIKRKR